jgi:hypothetical protein
MYESGSAGELGHPKVFGNVGVFVDRRKVNTSAGSGGASGLPE